MISRTIALAGRKGIQMSLRQLNTPNRLFPEEINMIYDSKCNLCMYEVNFLAKKDKQGKIRFTDIEDENYNPKDPANGGIDYATGMKTMHAVKTNGEIVQGVDVFRELYSQIGLGYLYSFTKIPVLGQLADKVYRFWAKYRTNLTRGVNLDALIKERNERLQKQLENSSFKNGSTCDAMKNSR